MTTLVIIAKQPLPGKAKTRLHPAVSYEQAAELAAAAIDDTIAAVAEVPAARRILFYDGVDAPFTAVDYEIMHQPGGTLDERLAHLFDTVFGPVVLIGMDTPQLTRADLAPAFEGWPDDVDSFFGPALDGGFWALGMREPRGYLVRGIPMSQDDTGARQLERLSLAGHRIGLLRPLNDVDTIDDAVEVARLAPQTRFARTLDACLVAS